MNINNCLLFYVQEGPDLEDLTKMYVGVGESGKIEVWIDPQHGGGYHMEDLGDAASLALAIKEYMLQVVGVDDDLHDIIV